MSTDTHITRRQTLAGLRAARTGPGGAPPAGLAAAPPRAAAGILPPEGAEGPYYVNIDKVRRDITEGRPGVPLRLRTYVVDSDTCKPIHNAAVEIWHCDALGVYSDESSENTLSQTWLRGTQVTDSNGLAI